MTRRAALMAVTAALILAAPARADDAGRLAVDLRADDVHVEPGVAARLPPGARAQVRQGIADRDPGRIRIVVVAPDVPRRAGGINLLADAIGARLRAKGTLLVVAGRNWWLNTSYPPARVTAAVQHAADSQRDLRAQLLAAVASIGAVDPGPAGDGAGGSAPGSRRVSGGLSEGARSVIVVAAGAGIAALLAALLFLGLRRGSPASRR